MTQGVETGKTFILMCIIQNMLQYHIRQIINVDPLKPKIMKLASTRKATFNINETIIHSTLIITLNRNLNKFLKLINERWDSLIKRYQQLHLLIIDEIYFVADKLLTFINNRLRVIKQVHNEFVGGFDIIMIGDYYWKNIC